MIRPEVEHTRMLTCKIASQFAKRLFPRSISGKKLTDDEMDTIKTANASKSGLVSISYSIWTQDLEPVVSELSSMTRSYTATAKIGVVISQAGVKLGGLKNSGSGKASSNYGEPDPVNIKSTEFYYQLILSQYRE